MSRRLRYQVAMSLDGFIADPDDGYDWLVMDEAIDFAALYAEFDVAVMGRRTYEAAIAQGEPAYHPKMEMLVFSRSLPPALHRGMRVVRDDARDVVRALKGATGRDIWLFGGGDLFRSLLDAGLVDSVELAVMPVLLGSGVPVLPPGAHARLTLAEQRTLPASGIVMLAYSVPGGAGAPPISYVRSR